MKLNLNIGGDEFATAKIIQARKTKWFYGRDVGEHGVFDIDFEHDGRKYEAKLPLILQEGLAWEFARNDSRIVTEADQLANWSEVLAKFADYAGPRELTQEAVDAFVGWLKSGEAKARIRLGGVTTDRNGVEHWSCRVVKSSKLPDIEPAKPKAKARNTPAAPKSTMVYTADDAWNAYEGGDRIKSDPSGANYWAAVSEIVGKPATHASVKDFTSEDWMKCVEAFCPMPF